MKKYNTIIKQITMILMTLVIMGSLTTIKANADSKVTVKYYKSYNLPNDDKDFNFKAYMDYRTLTDKQSKQYTLQQMAYTDSYGFRRFGNHYMVAVGTYYSDKCGEELRIKLSNNFEFTAIVGDIKADEHTDENNQYRPMKNNQGNIVEFIVDIKVMNKQILKSGDISNVDDFSGDVVSISKLVKVE